MKNDEIGWTLIEYEKCPKLINRLHSHILDLMNKIDKLENERDKRIAFTDAGV